MKKTIVRSEIMAKYVKKPVVVEAVKWNGNNIEEVKEFMKE